MVGGSLYHATNRALSTRADYQLIGRVEHFRSLLHDLYTIKEIEARPKLFETMLGDRQDVIIFDAPASAVHQRQSGKHAVAAARCPCP